MSVFKFKRFNIIQEKSAMKVGTDGVLLGSWSNSKKSNEILDIGCGTGLIALMLAQRNSKASITAIEIDEIASREAKQNINNSNWNERICIINTSLQDFKTEIKFDLIVSNPPFFPATKFNERRDIARHTNSLSFEDLIKNAASLLAERGNLSVIIPEKSRIYFCETAARFSLFCNRICYVKGTQNSESKRVLMEFSFIEYNLKKEYLVIEKARGQYTNDYIDLCQNFYLKM